MKKKASSYVTLEAYRFRVWQGMSPHDMGVAHTHSDLEMNYILAGHVRYLHAGRFVELPEGTLAILWGGLPHRKFESPANTKMIWVTLPLQWAMAWDLPGTLIQDLLQGRLVSDSEHSERDRQLLLTWVDDFASSNPERQQTIILELHARLRRLSQSAVNAEPAGWAESSKLKRVATALSYLHSHFRAPIKVTDVAAACGVHSKYLSKLFKEQLRIGVREYLLRTRIAHAQRLLASSDHLVTDIALESGFRSVASFYDAFHRFNPDLSPREYRTVLRGTNVPAKVDQARPHGLGNMPARLPDVGP